MEEEVVIAKPKKKKKHRDITIPANKKGRHIMPLMNFLRVVFISCFRLIYPFRLYGNKKVKDGACVYYGNHYRIWDVVYMASTTWEGIHFLAKRSVTENWFMKGFCKKLRVIPVNRDGNDIRAVMDSMKCLKNNEKISIFPEGTRNKTKEEMLPFKSGAASLAIKAKTPIVPLLIYKKPMPFRMAHIIVGEPFELTEFYDRHLSLEDLERANKILYDKLIEMKKEHTLYLQNKKNKKKNK